MKPDEDDDFVDDGIEDDEDVQLLEEYAAKADFSSKLHSRRSGRVRRNWRDVERVREERELKRLMSAQDDWFAEIDEAPRRLRR